MCAHRVGLIDTLSNTSGDHIHVLVLQARVDATKSLADIEKIWSGEIHAILVFHSQNARTISVWRQHHLSVKELEATPFECEGIGGNTISV